jgi:hypothetical protein
LTLIATHRILPVRSKSARHHRVAKGRRVPCQLPPLRNGVDFIAIVPTDYQFIGLGIEMNFLNFPEGDAETLRQGVGGVTGSSFDVNGAILEAKSHILMIRGKLGSESFGRSIETIIHVFGLYVDDAVLLVVGSKYYILPIW